jgi:hypothetical protein
MIGFAVTVPVRRIRFIAFAAAHEFCWRVAIVALEIGRALDRSPLPDVYNHTVR